MGDQNGTASMPGKAIEAEKVEVGNRDAAQSSMPMSRQELRAVQRAERHRSYLVARHLVLELGWPVTPAFHDENGKCGKHPSVPWNCRDVAAGKIAGPATTDEQTQLYFLDERRGLADVCVHTGPAEVVVVDCDRAEKERVVEGKVQPVFVDGLRNLLEFAGGDIGSTLVSRTRRGLHLFYAADSDDALRIKTQAGALLDGVDVRGCVNSGGITVESNGVCPHRRWCYGTPRIDDHGAIVGLQDLGPIEFDSAGNCISGLPMRAADGWPEGIAPLPELLLDACLFTSGVRTESEVDSRVVDAWRRRLQAKGSSGRRAPRGGDASAQPARTGTARTIPFPFSFSTNCTCGRCDRFDEAKSLLAWIAPEVGRDAWRTVIFGTADLLHGSPCGADLVAEWSNLSCVPSRRDPAGARRIYENDRRFRQEAAHV